MKNTSLNHPIAKLLARNLILSGNTSAWLWHALLKMFEYNVHFRELADRCDGLLVLPRLDVAYNSTYAGQTKQAEEILYFCQAPDDEALVDPYRLITQCLAYLELGHDGFRREDEFGKAAEYYRRVNFFDDCGRSSWTT